MGAWFAVYGGFATLPLAGLDPQLWHGHEMVFGFAAAIIAGFLLTAVRNWTSRPTISGVALLLPLGAWATARGLPFAASRQGLAFMAAADMVFWAALFVGVLVPIARARQTRHAFVLGALAALGASNALFYYGALTAKPSLSRQGLYLGLYAVLLMVLIVAARVVPFFIEKGLANAKPVIDRKWLAVGTPTAFAAYALLDVFASAERSALPWLAGALFLLSALRLADWYQHGVHKRPLLWVLLAAYAGFPVGFALRALEPFGVSTTLALHAFATASVGLMTLGMMVRVSLGHTGRDIHAPPRTTALIFALAVVGFGARVLGPLAGPLEYATWVAIAQVAWMLAFALFVVTFARALVAPRPDGRPG